MIVGIDLGTTFSVVATVDDQGRPRVLPNRLDAATTPSVVHFLSTTEAEVGEAAQAAAAVDPDHTVALIKRQMGRDVPLRFHGVDHTPESVSGVLLRALAADARAAVGAPADEPVRAVVTVPAYFGLREREATGQAAALAGLELLELVAEPVAAGLHHGLDRARSGRTGVLVYDLGGGTFDATLLRVDADGVHVVATDGDQALGGADVDERLAEVLLDRLVDVAGRESGATGGRHPGDDPDDDPRDDESVVVAARAAAETAKRALSSATRHTVHLRTRQRSVAVTVERAELESLAADLIDRTMEIVERLLRVAPAGSSGGPVDEVVLVGGSSRMPVVAERMTARFGLVPRRLDPDLTVALGAARRASQLAGGAGAGSSAVSVLPRAVGVLVRDSHDPAGVREFVQHVLSANAALPAEQTTPFATILPDQRTARIQIFEQAGGVPSPEIGDNRRVLDGELTGLDRLPAGSRIDITVRADTDGRLDVLAREPRTGTELHLDACIDGVVDAAATAELTAVTRDLTISG